MAKTRTRLLFIGGTFLILLMWYGPTISSLIQNAYAYLPKTGKVIDGATGKGIPNIPVIASAVRGGTGLAHGFHHNLYRVVTHTDADGIYHIPSRWSSAESEDSFPFNTGEDIHIYWTITAFKIGYAIVGDDAALKPDAAGVLGPNSTWFSPKAHFGLPEIQVEPIVMRTVSLSESEAVWYYGSFIGNPGWSDWMTPEELALRRIAYDYFAPRICSMDPQQPLTWVAGDFVDDVPKYADTIMKIRENAEKKNPGTGKTVSRLAGSECTALKAGEEDR